MRIGGFGLPELLVLLLIILLIFGATKLPQLGESLGKGIRSFRKGVSDDSDVKENEKPSGTLASKTTDAPAVGKTAETK